MYAVASYSRSPFTSRPLHGDSPLRMPRTYRRSGQQSLRSKCLYGGGYLSKDQLPVVLDKGVKRHHDGGVDIHPRKLYTKKCSTIEPRVKSANARSGETSLNSERFSGLTCARREAVRTNWPTQLAKPARKALNGKLVTSTQYANCTIPENMMNTRKASINLSRSDVC